MLNQDFFRKDTTIVARELIGKVLHLEDKQIVLTETEAYHGFNDKASHAHKGITKRNTVMYDTVGHTYVYIIYGMHSMLNITTVSEGFPGAVLIRGGYDLINRVHLKGPGILTKYLGINRSFNNMPVFTGDSLWFEDKGYSFNIKSAKRIGIDYAEESRDLLWRFYVDNNEIVMIN